MTRCQNGTPPRASASTVAHEKKGMAAAEMQDLATVGLPQKGPSGARSAG